MILTKKQLFEHQKPPWYYGLAYIDIKSLRYIYYIFPFNYIVSLARNIYFIIIDVKINDLEDEAINNIKDKIEIFEKYKREKISHAYNVEIEDGRQGFSMQLNGRNPEYCKNPEDLIDRRLRDRDIKMK